MQTSKIKFQSAGLGEDAATVMAVISSALWVQGGTLDSQGVTVGDLATPVPLNDDLVKKVSEALGKEHVVVSHLTKRLNSGKNTVAPIAIINAIKPDIEFI